MFDSVLFSAGNRALGSSIGDFSLYGGQADGGASRDARQDDSAPQNLGLSSPGAAGIADVAQAGSASHDGGFGSVGESGAGSSAPAAFLLSPAVAPIQAPAPLHDEIAPTFTVPAAGGSGSPIPHFAAAIAETIVTSADSGAPHVAQAFQSVAPVGDAARAVAPMLDIADHAATELVAPALGAVTDLAAPVLHTTGELLGSAVDAAEDTLSDLAGADPLGGVATLVSLVSVTDLFGIHSADTLSPDPPGDLGLGVVDTLAGDGLLPGSLLGASDHHHDDGGLGHILDHPLGL